MGNKRVSIRETLRLSYSLFRNNGIFFVKLLNLIVALTIILVILDSGFLWSRGKLAANNLGLLFFMGVVFLFRLLLFDGVKKVVLKMHNNSHFELDDLYLESEVYCKLIVFWLVLLLTVVIYLAAMGTGTALLSGLIYYFSANFWLSLFTGCLLGIGFITAAFYLYVRVYFTPYILVNANLELIAAVKYSFLLTKGVGKKLFLLHVSWKVINFFLFTLWNWLAVETVYIFNSLVGVFVVPTFFILVFADIYLQLVEESETEFSEDLSFISLIYRRVSSPFV